MVVDGSAKRGIWRSWRVCARCVMSLGVSLCLFWKVWRSWRALMVYGQTLVVVGLVVRLPIVFLVQVRLPDAKVWRPVCRCCQGRLR